MLRLLLLPKAWKWLNGNSNGHSCWGSNKANLIPQMPGGLVCWAATPVPSPWGGGSGAGRTKRTLGHNHWREETWLNLRRGEVIAGERASALPNPAG